VFTKTEVAFLKVGHTHEDIDQRFSVLSKFLNLHDAITPSQWVLRCAEAFAATGKRYQLLHTREGPPVIEYLHSLYGYSAWLKPHIEPEYSGTDGPFLIEFTLCPTRNRCVQRYKHLSSSGDWFPHGRYGEIGGDSAPQSELVPDCGLDYDSSPSLRVLQLLSPAKLKLIFKSVMKFVHCKLIKHLILCFSFVVHIKIDVLYYIDAHPEDPEGELTDRAEWVEWFNKIPSTPTSHERVWPWSLPRVQPLAAADPVLPVQVLKPFHHHFSPACFKGYSAETRLAEMSKAKEIVSEAQAMVVQGPLRVNELVIVRGNPFANATDINGVSAAQFAMEFSLAKVVEAYDAATSINGEVH
jgi:hypothetical protein